MQLRTMEFTLFLRELSSKISIASDRDNLKRSFIPRFDAFSNGYDTGEYEYRMARIDQDILQRSIDRIKKMSFYTFFSHMFRNISIKHQPILIIFPRSYSRKRGQQ